MTDRECLMQIVQSLGLEKTDERYPDHKEFSTRTDDTCVVIGSGGGYSCFYAEFSFDDSGKVIEHWVAE